MVPLSLTLFGDIKLKVGPAVEIPLPRKTQILLVYLASSPEKKFTRSKLASLVWADRSEGQARQSFRQCLFALAKSIGDDVTSIVNVDRQYVSMKQNTVEVDIWSFERLLAIDTPDSLQQAVALYADDFANNVRFDSGTIDTWCAGERTRLRDLCFETLVNLSSHYADTARLDEAIKASRRLVTLDPLREDGHRTLIRLYSRAGRRAEAIKQYRECLTVLRTELNVKPEAATLTLYSDIMRTGDEAKPDLETTDALPDQLSDTREGIPATADWKQKCDGGRTAPDHLAFSCAFLAHRWIIELVGVG
jgi:DNA-binding SARP family transcriptional activator